MIGYLRGKVLDLELDSVLLDCQGIGYELSCSPTTLASLQPNEGASLWVYTHVREDALILFGFGDKLEKQLFLQLLKVNGVGPKMAMNILGGGSVDDIHRMIENEDAKGLAKLPKVGKKTAEQIVLTLKGKLVLVSNATIDGAQAPLKVKSTDSWRELASALVNLGFRPAEVDKVITDLPKDADFESQFRQALATLSRF